MKLVGLAMLALLTENEIAIIGLLGMCVAQITLPLRVFDSRRGIVTSAGNL